MYLAQKSVKGHEYWYLEEKEHTDKGPRTSFSLYLGKPERLYERLTQPLQRMTLSTHAFGRPATLLHAADHLQLEQILDEEISLDERIDMTTAQRLLTILCARYDRPASKLDSVSTWYNNSLLPVLWQVNAPHVNTIYETMDQLTPEVRTRIKERLRQRLLELGHEPTYLVWDTTNFFTYGPEDELRQRGRSKDGKHTCPLVGLGLLTSDEDVPLAQLVFPGNRNDVSVFQQAVPSLLELLEEVTADPADVTLIFDRGCNDAGVLGTLEQTTHFVGKLARDQDPADLLQTPIDDLESLFTSATGQEVRGLRTEGEAFEAVRPLVVMWHEGTAAKQQTRQTEVKEECLATCRDLEDHVGRPGPGRNYTASGIRRRLNSFEEVSAAFEWSFDEEAQSFSWRFDADEWDRLVERAGKSLLFTSRSEWAAERVIKAYSQSWRVERSFRLLKGPVSVRPIFHSDSDRVREHCFLLFLLLVLHRWLMSQLREPVLNRFELGEETVHQLLGEVRLVTGTAPERDTPEFAIEKLGTIEEAIFEELALDRFIPETQAPIERR